MSQYQSRVARLMHSMGDGKNIPEDTGAGGAGTSVGGDAGLSHLGAIPNGSAAIITGKRQCPACHLEFGQSVKWCPECGSRLEEARSSSNGRESMSEFEERYNRKQREVRERDTSPVYEEARQEGHHSQQRLDTTVGELMKTMRRSGYGYLPDSRIAEERLQGQFYRLLGEFAAWRLQEEYQR